MATVDMVAMWTKKTDDHIGKTCDRNLRFSQSVHGKLGKPSGSLENLCMGHRHHMQATGARTESTSPRRSPSNPNQRNRVVDNRLEHVLGKVRSAVAAPVALICHRGLALLERRETQRLFASPARKQD